MDPYVLNSYEPIQSPNFVTVVHKTTREVRYGVPDNQYDTNTWVHNPNQDLINSGYWKVVGDVITNMSQAEKDQLDADNLAAAKTAKCVIIDKRTDQLIALGFTYAGKIFSLSANGQARLMGTNQIRNASNLVYPIKWNTLDDTDVLLLNNAIDVLNFYLTAASTYRAHVDSGTALKDQVRAATTVVAVQAITDNR
jgi:hypothetical protein